MSTDSLLRSEVTWISKTLLISLGHEVMHARGSVFSIVILLLLSIIGSSFAPSTGAETIIAIEKWTVSRELGEDLIIKAGAQLTIEKGVSVEITADVTITVEGTLIISGSASNTVSITANITQASEGGSLASWRGIVVTSGGHLSAENATIADAVTAIEVGSGASADLKSLLLHNSTNGLNNSGSTTITASGCENIQNGCITNHGTLSADTITTTDSGQLALNTGDATFTDIEGIDVGVLIDSADGASGSFMDVEANGVGLVLRAHGDQSATTFTAFGITDADLLIDASGSSGLSMDDVVGVQIDSLLLADGADSLMLADFTITADDSPYIAIRAITSGTLEFDSIDLDGHSQTFLLSGGGHAIFDDSTLSAEGRVGQLISSTLNAEGGAWHGDTDGLDAQHSDVVLKNLNISVGDGHGTALRSLGGDLDLEGQVNLSHAYDWLDTSSIGMQAIWSEVDSETLAIDGFSIGVSCETTSTASFDSLTITEIRGTGYLQACSESRIDALTTSSGDFGLESVDGEISISEWSASSHGAALLRSEAGASTYVRDWSGSDNTTAAQGEASALFYGSDDIFEVFVTVPGAQRYTERSIEVTDLSGALAIEDVEVSLHGFSEVSDLGGLVTLPLAAIEVDVTAFDPLQSIGRTKALSTMDADPRIELPVLPDDGSDWVISDGVSIVLDRFSGSLTSSIVIESGGMLDLVDTQLSALTVFVEEGGALTGTDSTLASDGFSINSTLIGAAGASLVLDGPIQISCETTSFDWTGVHLDGTVHLNTASGCTLYLFGGGTSGDVIIALGGALKQFSDLSLSVVDEGVPIAGASVSLNGTRDPNEVTSATTDADGLANLRAQSLVWDETGAVGGFDVGRTVSMEIPALGISQNQYWAATSSSEATFVASTLESDEVTNYRGLTKQWSPYYLFDDLVVSGLMEIEDGVDLQISTGIGLTVEGTLDIGSASLHGSDWSGISVDGGSVDLDGTFLMNAVQSLSLSDSATAILDGATLSNSIAGHLKLLSGSSALISDSSFTTGDNCIFTSSDATISLSIESSSIANCAVGMRISGASIDVNGLEITGVGTGARLAYTSGSLESLTIHAEDAGLELVEISQDTTTLSDSVLFSETGAGLSVEDSIGVSIELISASSIHLLRTTLNLSDSTTAELLVDGTRSNSFLYIHNITADVLNATAIGIDMCLWITNSSILETYSELCMWVFDSSLGDLRFTPREEGTLVPTFLFDSPVNMVNISENGAVGHYQSHHFEYRLSGESIRKPPDSDIGIRIGSSPASDITSSEVLADEFQVHIRWRLDTFDGNQTYTNATLITAGFGLEVNGVAIYTLPDEFDLAIGPEVETRHVIELEMNAPPAVSITMPEGMTSFAQGATTTPSGSPTQITYTAIDEHGVGQVFATLVNLDTGAELAFTNQTAFELSGLDEGDYLLTLTVIDVYGAPTSIARTFSITPPDADADNIETCDPNSWYDDVEQRLCGPDDVDLDDDNDGLRDEVDAFPYDACATVDTDSDGLPDEIREGCTTTLEADDDDDGDGVLDADEVGSAGGDGGPQFTTILSILGLLIIGGAALRRFRRDEG